MTDAEPIPISIVTGFLGAGKSTLLSKLLRAPELANALVIVNEWGEIGLDHLLVERIDGDTLLLSSGCLCCALRGDLVEALRDLALRRERGAIAAFERIIIETSGLADPGPILHAILADPELWRRYRLAGVLTLVDAVNGGATLESFKESQRQVASADKLAITKSDLLDPLDRPAAMTRLRMSLRTLNPGASIADVAAGEFSAAELVALNSFELAPPAGRLASAGFAADHNFSIRAHSLRLQEPIRTSDFETFLSLLRAALGPRLLRVKGLAALAEHPDEPLVIHSVQHILHPPRRLKAWPNADRTTRIVVIVDGVERASVDKIFAALSGIPQIDAPDLSALAGNPLAPVPGGLLA
jgi:G3E family GTPase